MDAVTLRNSCICGNTLPYAECCGAFSEAPGDPEADAGREGFRHALHELCMYLFPLRNLYQAYWERLSQEGYPHHLLMADADYGRAVMGNFFWDYSVQFSDARPILRAARDVEERNLRLSNDFRQWSLAPLWPWYVVESDERHAYVRRTESEKPQRVEHGGELPGPGRYVLLRILPYRGRDHVHPGVLILPEDSGARLAERLRILCRNLGVKSGSGLRPDVQCEEWRRHGELLLGLWREMEYDARVGVPSRKMSAPQSFHLPAEGGERTLRQLRAGGAVPSGKGRFELRHRALSLARLEAEETGVRVTLLDEAYRPYVFRWLGDHLGAASRPEDEAVPSAASGFSGWKSWVRDPHEGLGGETPMEASLHDFGRRRLAVLLTEMEMPARELSALKRQLGL